MKNSDYMLNQAKQVLLLPLLLAAAWLYSQSALAGSNAAGQPSGSTVAGTATIQTPAMSALTASVKSETGQTMTTSPPTTGTATTAGAVVTSSPVTAVSPATSASAVTTAAATTSTPAKARTITVPSSTIASTFASIGLQLPSNGSSAVYAGVDGGTFTVTNQGSTMTITHSGTP